MKKILFTFALLVSFSSFGQTSKEYFDSGYDKVKADDFSGAISDFTKAIELDPNYADAYFERGHIRYLLGDEFDLAIADFTTFIELVPDNIISTYIVRAYYCRALSKFELDRENVSGAIADLTKAIELRPDYRDAYFHRGYIKEGLNDYTGSISDYTKAMEFSVFLDANLYYRRGLSKEQFGDLSGACIDWKKALELGDVFGEAAKKIANQCK